ncbi:MAG: hypothetical protein E6Q97_27800, partial [Desulfurellales bacterium]
MKHLLTSIFLAICLAAAGQNTDLAQKYSLSSFATGPLNKSFTYETARNKYGAFVQWAEFLGMTRAELLSVNEFAAAWNNEIWSTDGYVAPNVQGAYPQNGCQSRVNINASGVYYAKTNIPCIVAFGKYTGGGTGNYTDATGTTGGTQIEVDHAAWLSRIFPGRYLFQTDTWATNTIMGYQESFIFEGFRLEGGWTSKVHDPSFESAGIAIWDSGETSRVEHVYAFGFNSYGFLNVRGTPTIFNGCSAFSCGIGGFGLLGNDLATIALYSPSGDDNAALIFIDGAYDRPGGSTITIVAAKHENGKRTPVRDQRLIRARGACNIVVDGASVHSTYTIETLIEVDFQQYLGQIDVRGLRYDGYANMLKHTSNGRTQLIKGPGAYAAVSFVATEQGLVSSTRGGTVQPPPPPASCTYAYSDWGPCVNGTRTRTVTSATPAGCTGTPVLTENCSTPPPVPVPSAIDPNDVLVVTNTADPSSAAMATAYAQAWGIPAANMVSVNLGGTDNLASASTLNTARTTINGQAKQYTVLAFARPSRYNNSQSITSAITFGPRSATNLTVSALYNYTGTKPRTDKGVAPSFLLYSASYIRRDAHGTKPAGKDYQVLAKDQSGTPRGSARAGQAPSGVIVWDNRTLSNVGEGNNGCNYLSMSCWVAGRDKPETILTYYGSMYAMDAGAGLSFAKGFYGDNVTSTGATLPSGA